MGENRNSARVTANITPTQQAELERIAKQFGVSVSYLIRRSVERTIDEANGGPLLPLSFPGESRNAA